MDSLESFECWEFLPGHGKGMPSSSQSQTLSGCSEQSLALETHQPERELKT